MKNTKAQEFLRSMGATAEPAPAPKSEAPAAPQPSPAKEAPSKPRGKHIGGYFDDSTVEKVALLRARLKLDNSGLIKLMIEDFYAKHLSRRAFE